MLYMKEMRANVVAECTLKESAAINQILGRRVRIRFAVAPGGLSRNFCQTQFKTRMWPFWQVAGLARYFFAELGKIGHV